MRRLTAACLAAVIVILGGVGAHTAEAGCLNLCEVKAGAFSVDPSFAPCAQLEHYADGCDCEMSFVIRNGCSGAIAAEGFTFDSCSSLDGLVHHQCAQVDSGQSGRVQFPLPSKEGTGLKEREVTVKDADGTHVIKISATIDSFGNGCAMTRTPRPRGGMAVVGISLGLLALERRRSAHRG
jgi:hypothetical protein